MLCCRRHRLVIQTQPPAMWYKDEGGRDKCIELAVRLTDASGVPVVDRADVQLRVLLLYEDHRQVAKQDIMKLSPDTTLTVGADGTAHLRLRIEDVSKNHQNQPFRIWVTPDTTKSPLNFDISSDVSSPVTVRSKRNKRTRRTSPLGACVHKRARARMPTCWGGCVPELLCAHVAPVTLRAAAPDAKRQSLDAAPPLAAFPMAAAPAMGLSSAMPSAMAAPGMAHGAASSSCSASDRLL